jgi:molybdopterin converting factor small subunit
MIVNVKLFGSLEKLAGNKIVEIEIEKEVELKIILKKLIELINKEEFRNALESSGSCVVFVNGIEISALNKLNTLVKDGSEVAIVPVAHGG